MGDALNNETIEYGEPTRSITRENRTIFVLAVLPAIFTVDATEPIRRKEDVTEN